MFQPTMTFLGSSCIFELHKFCTVRNGICSEQCTARSFQHRHLLTLSKCICWLAEPVAPQKITDPEFESLSTTLISCYCHRPLLSSLGLCYPNAGLVLHSCPPLITQLRSPEEVVQDAFVNTPSHTDHLPSPLLL